MRSYLSLLFINLLICSEAQIPNFSFENWTSMGTYENPDAWATLNNSTAQSGTFTATKGSPGNPGNYYLKLTSRTTGTTVVGAIAISGQLDSINHQPKCGFPFNQVPLAFTGRWQHMIYGSTQGSVRVLLTKYDQNLSQRKVIATASVNLVGMAMSWANFSINFNYTDSVLPDSCMIILRASGAVPANNDYLWVDNLGFSGTLTLPDPAALEENGMSSPALSIYPQPVCDFLNIVFPDEFGNKAEIRLYELSGSCVLHSSAVAEFRSSPVRLDLSGIKPGLYQLVLEGEALHQAIRVLKE
ncbi:MAG TPA: hypothetical protein PLQ93_02890 [Bacteroidia bacterium]|nr:hypothetical protein [Bacteroidia bacterium]